MLSDGRVREWLLPAQLRQRTAITSSLVGDRQQPFCKESAHTKVSDHSVGVNEQVLSEVGMHS